MPETADLILRPGAQEAGQPVTLAHYILRKPTLSKENTHDPSGKNRPKQLA